MTLVRRLGIAAILLWALVVTVLRALRLPNDFAEAHWLLDYRFGFVRRGLVGTVVSLLTSSMHIRPTEQLVAVLSGVAFAVYCTVIYVLGLRTIHRSGWSTGALLAVLAFFSSPFIVMSAHLVGYYDNLIIMLAVVSIVLLFEGRIWFGACLQAASILVHESSILIGFPVFCVAWLLANCQRDESAQLPRGPLLLPVAAFLVLAVSQSVLLPREFEQSLARHLSDFQFIQGNWSTLVPRWLTNTFLESYSAHRGEVLWRLDFFSMYSLVGPSMLALLCFTIDAHSIRTASAESIALLVACLVPQTMHMAAWDTPRIWTYSVLCAFLMLWIYAEVFVARRNVSPAVKLLCLAALVWNIMQETPLMDGEIDHFNLKTRLLLYSPVLGATLALGLGEDPLPMRSRLSIRGRAISRLLRPTERCSRRPPASARPSLPTPGADEHQLQAD